MMTLIYLGIFRIILAFFIKFPSSSVMTLPLSNSFGELKYVNFIFIY